MPAQSEEKKLLNALRRALDVRSFNKDAAVIGISTFTANLQSEFFELVLVYLHYNAEQYDKGHMALNPVLENIGRLSKEMLEALE